MRRVAKKSMADREKPAGDRPPVNLRELAKHLNLSPTTLSLVLNGSPGADSIPANTKQRIFDAAQELNYRPSHLARSLRAQRSFTVGVMIPELSDGYCALVLGGIEDYLLRQHYMFLVSSHHHKAPLIEQHTHRLLQRSVEGLIAVDTPLTQPSPVPVLCVSGHAEIPGTTNIVLNHDKAAELALTHLVELGHRHIAVIKGQEFSSDTLVRWSSIKSVSRRIGLAIREKHVVQLEGMTPSPELGYQAAKTLIKRGVDFTALLAFNDISAIGAVRAFREADYAVPDQISIVGFDDVYEAAYYIPALTTIRQPLARMGALAAELLLKQIQSKGKTDETKSLQVDPELVVRESTCPSQPASQVRSERR